MRLEYVPAEGCWTIKICHFCILLIDNEQLSIFFICAQRTSDRSFWSLVYKCGGAGLVTRLFYIFKLGVYVGVMVELLFTF